MSGPGETSQQATGPAPGILLLDCITPDVSSTDIRTRSGNGRSIAGLVPPLVEGHIIRHRLYPSGAVHAGGGSHHRTANLLHEQEHR